MLQRTTTVGDEDGPTVVLLHHGSHSEGDLDFERAITRDEEAPNSAADEDLHSSLRGTAKSMRQCVYQRTWPHVEAYDGPTLIVHGDEEHNTDHAEELAGRVDTELRWQQGGHHASIREPEAFIRLVTEFVTGVYEGS